MKVLFLKHLVRLDVTSVLLQWKDMQYIYLYALAVEYISAMSDLNSQQTKLFKGTFDDQENFKQRILSKWGYFASTGPEETNSVT